MVKRKAQDGWVEGSELGGGDTEPSIVKVTEANEDAAVVACLPEPRTSTRLLKTPDDPHPTVSIDQEVSPEEWFWRLLATTGYECW